MDVTKEKNRKFGKLHVIFGPMFSGKTTEMLKRVRMHRLSNKKCIVIRYARDTRYSEENVATHDGVFHPAVEAVVLESVKEDVKDFEVIGIDEGQFFRDLEEFCKEQIDLGKTIIVAGLDGTFQMTGFDNMLKLVPLAQSIVKLSAVCMSCGKKAPFTKRIGNETEIEVIGGLDKYMAVCRGCYNKPVPEKSSPFKKLEKEKILGLANDTPDGNGKRKILADL